MREITLNLIKRVNLMFPQKMHLHQVTLPCLLTWRIAYLDRTGQQKEINNYFSIGEHEFFVKEGGYINL